MRRIEAVFVIPGLFLAAALAPSVYSQSDPVTFSVNGPVDSHTDGLRRARGSATPFGTYNFTRLASPVMKAIGVATIHPGDVNDYFVMGVPSEAELFQSEPDLPPAAGPSGTNNQILVASMLGLVAGLPSSTYRDNINGVSFGEDHFGVTSVSAFVQTNPFQAWHQRAGAFLEPTVTGDSGTSFRLSPDPWGIGLTATGLRAQAGPADTGTGLGPWSSPLPAAGDIFATPILTRPGAPFLGTNTLVIDQPLLALFGSAPPAVPLEDDLDALECVGSNDPTSWLSGSALVQPGNLRARLATTGLGAPGVPTHYFDFFSAPVFFTVDRNSRGAALSAVRTQALWMPGGPQAAGDVFMAFSDDMTGFGAGTNYLFIDETEAGLFGGGGGNPPDDMDALILKIHPDDRYKFIELVKYHMPNGYNGQVVQTIDPDGIPGNGNEYRTGPGFSYSLFKFFYEEFGYLPNPVARIRLGFSVTTDSIGLVGTAVDYEAGLKPTAQQAGDIFFTQFGDWANGMGVVNPEPFASGTNYLWYQETEIGLDAGNWVNGVSTNLALLPDELNGLDSTDGLVAPSDDCFTAVAIVEGIDIVSHNVTATTGGAPVGACGAMANDVWFTFVPNCTGQFKATTCVAGTNYDSVVAVWDGTAGCGGLVPIACNDDSCVLPGQFLSSTATFNAIAGTTYYVSVGGYAGATGYFRLVVSRVGSMTLAFTTPGFGLLGFTVNGGPPGGQVLTAITANAGTFPNGWFLGIDIPLLDLVAEVNFGLPFVAPLDGCGNVVLGPFPAPSALTLYGVSAGFPSVSSPSPPVSVTVP